MTTQTFEAASVMEIPGIVQSVVDEVVQQVTDLDYSPQLKEMGQKLGEIHQGYFDREGGPSGGEWPKWYFRRPDAPKEHPTLNVTGRLRGSLAGGGSGDHIEEVNATSLTWGTSVPYSFKHQDGGEFDVESFLIGRRGGAKWPGVDTINLPQREHVGLNDENLMPLVEGVADFVVKELKT